MVFFFWPLSPKKNYFLLFLSKKKKKIEFSVIVTQWLFNYRLFCTIVLFVLDTLPFGVAFTRHGTCDEKTNLERNVSFSISTLNPIN